MSSDVCAMGLITPLPSSNCMSVLTNQVFCGVELAIGFFVVGKFLFEIRRVQKTIQIMLSCYCCLVVCVLVIAGMGIGEVDSTTNIKYIIFTIAHFGYTFGLSTRLHIFSRVIYLATQHRVEYETHWHSVAVFSAAVINCILILILWTFSPIYTDSLEEANDLRRVGFVIYGVYQFGIASVTLFMSRNVITLFKGLRMDDNEAEMRQKKKSLQVLRQMTISAVLTMFSAGTLYVLLGAFNGALRNEVAHLIFIWALFAMFPLLRFVRQHAEVRAANEERRSTRHVELGKQQPASTMSKSTSTSRLPQVESDSREKSREKSMGENNA